MKRLQLKHLLLAVALVLWISGPVMAHCGHCGMDGKQEGMHGEQQKTSQGCECGMHGKQGEGHAHGMGNLKCAECEKAGHHGQHGAHGMHEPGDGHGHGDMHGHGHESQDQDGKLDDLFKKES